MKSLLAVVVTLLVAAALAHAESSPPRAGTTLEQNAPGSAIGKPEGGGAAQRGSEPNAGEVRPGNRDGNAPSASAGTLLRRPAERRIFGLPVTAAIVIGGGIAALALAGFAIERRRRARRA
jgi:hypothetical protein